jgi:DNA-binding transcriptional LysR family regulator
VALTEAGKRLLERVGPAAGVIAESFDELLQRSAQPSGTLRLLVQRSALVHVIEPVLPLFRREYPDVKLEIVVQADHTGLVDAGYDAGVRIGEYIDRDMVAVRVSRLFRWLVFGAPSYLQARGRPRVPEELSRHECIRYRRPDVGDIYRWEFERKGQAVTIDPPGSVLVNDAGLARTLARQGMGLIYNASINVAADVAQGALEPLLDDEVERRQNGGRVGKVGEFMPQLSHPMGAKKRALRFADLFLHADEIETRTVPGIRPCGSTGSPRSAIGKLRCIACGKS